MSSALHHSRHHHEYNQGSTSSRQAGDGHVSLLCCGLLGAAGAGAGGAYLVSLVRRRSTGSRISFLRMSMALRPSPM